jgi:hypothetical protein
MGEPVVGTIRQLTQEEERSMQSAILRSTTLDGEIEMVSADYMKKVRDWMREPDHAEHCDLAWLLDWVNRRPLSSIF